MKICFGSCLLLLFILELQLAMLQRFDLPADDFWSTLMRDTNFARDYDTYNNHDYINQGSEDFDAFAFTRDPKIYADRNPQNRNNFKAFDLPTDSKEEVYVFLDKGRTRYMPMNEQDRIKISHSDWNINGRNFPRRERQNFNNIGWANEHQEDGSNYDNAVVEVSRNRINFQKSHNCLKKLDRNYGLAQRQQDSFRDFDYFDELKSNYEKNRSKNHDKNCNKNNRNNFQRKTHFQKSYNRRKNQKCQEQRKQIQRDCISRQPEAKVITKNVATVEQQTVQVKSLAETEVLFGSPKDETTPINDEVNSQSDFKLGSPHQMQNNDENEEIVGSTLNTQNKAKNQNQMKNYKEKLPNNAQHQVNIHASHNEELPLTDSPITRIKIIKPKQKNKNRRRPTPVLDSNNPAVSATKTGNAVEKPKVQQNHVPPKPVISDNISDGQLIENSPKGQSALNTPQVEVNGAATSGEVSSSSAANLNAQPINTQVNEVSETENTESKNQAEELESEIETETDQNMGDATDLNNSEDRIYTYVTKLDGTAPNVDDQIKYMEPIAYETLLIEPNTKGEQSNQKFNRQLISKSKRNVQLRVVGSNRAPKPRKKKSKQTTTASASTTTTTTTTTTPILATIAENEEPVLQSSFQSDPQNANNNMGDKDNNNNNSYPRPAQRINQQTRDKQMNEQQDSQVLGSQRFFAEDYSNLCEQSQNQQPLDYLESDAEDYFDQQQGDGLYAAPDGNGMELYSAELNISQADCNDANDVSYDGDQHIQKIVGTVTPAPRRQLNDPCIT